MLSMTLAAAFLGALGMAAAAPAAAPRDVYSPPVLYPRAGTVWYSGQTHNVTWCVRPPRAAAPARR